MEGANVKSIMLLGYTKKQQQQKESKTQEGIQVQNQTWREAKYS